MDEPQPKVLQIHSAGGARQELQPEVPSAHDVARPGAPLGRFISEPFDLAVDALETARDRAVVLALEEGVGVGVGEVRVDVFP